MKSVLQINSLRKSFAGTPVLRDIDFTLDAGERCLVRGSNGCGKTTLLRCIALLEDFDDGTLRLFGETFGRNTPHNRRTNLFRSQRIGYVFQELEPWPHLSVLENIALPLRVAKGYDSEKANRIAMHYLRKVELAEREAEHPTFLSGGQKRRLLIARTLAMEPDLILLDEITANLDPSSTKNILKLLQELPEHTAVLLVSHDPSIDESWFDSVLRLDRGVALHSQINQRTPDAA